MSRRVPKTREEWQEAVDMAEFCLLLDSAKQYGLIEGGPVVNAEICAATLDCGRRRGIVPAALEILTERYLPEFL